MKNFLSTNTTSDTANFCFASFRGFSIDPIWYSAFGGFRLWFDQFEMPNKVPPISNGFSGVASGGRE
jgi:hypothetical protein